jgi:single-strand DNA-binding protein
MNNLNSVLIEGTLTEDPISKPTSKGVARSILSVVSTRYYKTENGIEQEDNNINVESFGKLAESIQETGKEGRGLRVVGRLKECRWIDADGNNRTKIVIIAEHVEWKPEFAKTKTSVTHEAQPELEEATA